MLIQLAHLTLLRLDLLEVATDDALERKLILALLFRDALVLHWTEGSKAVESDMRT